MPGRSWEREMVCESHLEAAMSGACAVVVGVGDKSVEMGVTNWNKSACGGKGRNIMAPPKEAAKWRGRAHPRRKRASAGAATLVVMATILTTVPRTPSTRE